MSEPIHDDPQALLKVGTTMNDRLISVITTGYAKGDSTEDEMIMTIYDNLCLLPSRQIAAHAMAGLIALAQATKWDLVLARPDGTRVVIHCDTEEEQTARALEIAKGQVK